MLKTVTLQEANGLLPLVQERFFRINLLLAHLEQLRVKAGATKKFYSFDKHAQNIKIIKKFSRKQKIKNSFKKINEVEDLIYHEMQNLMRLGAIIRSIFPPHIDFLSIKNNEPVFLCWHGGEKEITHCHHLDENSPIRHIIAQKSFFGPDLVH